jgi:hypothetical protein
VFGFFLGLGFFDGLERPLDHKQTFFPITFYGIGPMSATTITPTTYLRSWAVVVPIINVKFMVDQCLFPS